MAEKRFLVHLDLKQNELRNALIHPVATTDLPASPKEGQIVFDSTVKAIKIATRGEGTSIVWKTIVASSKLDEVVAELEAAIDGKVDKEEGKGLSTEDYTTEEKTKLADIEAGAQVNTVTGVKGDSETSYRTGNINITKANIGLGNVDNTSDLNKPISTATQAALDGKVDTTTTVNGKALSSNVTLTGADIAVSGSDTTKIDVALDAKQDEITSSNKLDADLVDDSTSTNKFVTEEDKEAWDNKVDKEEGKGLSENDFTDKLKDKLDGIEEGAEVNKIVGVQVNGTDLTIDDNRKVNVVIPSASEYTIAKKATAEEGMSATYYLTKDGTKVGEYINIPKDMVIESGSVKKCTVKDQPVEGLNPGDPYIDLVIANKESSHIYIPVKDLVDIYTGGNGITVNGYEISIDESVTATKTYVDTELASGLATKEDVIDDLDEIRSNAEAGKEAADTIATYGNIVTHNVDEFATAAQGAKADTAVQPASVDTLTNKTINADSNTISNIELDNMKSGVVQTSVRVAASAVDTAVVTEKAVRTELDLKANLVSPEFTGTPTAPTATAGTSTTQIATTAFVQNAIATQTMTLVEENEALSSVSGVCTWSIENTFGNEDVICTIKEVESGDEVVAGIKYTEDFITVTFNNDTDIAASTFKAVVIGQQK